MSPISSGLKDHFDFLKVGGGSGSGAGGVGSTSGGDDGGRPTWPRRSKARPNQIRPPPPPLPPEDRTIFAFPQNIRKNFWNACTQELASFRPKC